MDLDLDFKHRVKLVYVHHPDGNVLRSLEIEGATHQLPTVGKYFYMVAEPLEEGFDYRQINTNVVTEVSGETPIVFKTASGSTYQVYLVGGDHEN